MLDFQHLFVKDLKLNRCGVFSLSQAKIEPLALPATSLLDACIRMESPFALLGVMLSVSL